MTLEADSRSCDGTSASSSAVSLEVKAPMAADFTGDSASTATPSNTWAMFPVSSSVILGVVAFIGCYAFLFLFLAKFSTVILITMTGIIAIWISFLYTSGILCVLYMMVREYPLEELDENVQAKLQAGLATLTATSLPMGPMGAHSGEVKC